MAKQNPFKPYWTVEHIHVYYELEFGKDVIKPGDKIKIKNTRGDFTFHKWVHNSKLDKTWIDCMDNKTGEFRSFLLHDLKCIVKPKKSRKKKPNV